jgi:hypothetical protein
VLTDLKRKEKKIEEKQNEKTSKKLTERKNRNKRNGRREKCVVLYVFCAYRINTRRIIRAIGMERRKVLRVRQESRGRRGRRSRSRRISEKVRSG